MFSNADSMQPYTSGAWYSSGTIAYTNVVISSDWITNDGGAYDEKPESTATAIRPTSMRSAMRSVSATRARRI